MSFQPILPATGLVGWKFLERTQAAQTKAFNTSPTITRDTEYFADRIADIKSAEDLVSDRRLMRVALGAFGLDDDINNTFFIRKILEEGTLDPGSLANRLADNRYAELAKAFSFDLGAPNTALSDFASGIITKYNAHQFELAIGDQDQTMRLALNAKRELSELAGSDDSDRTRWFQIMGNAPLREVMEVALGLPDSFAQIDLDQQLQVFMEKAERQLGIDSLSDLTDENTMGKLIERYILRSEVQTSSLSDAGSIALILLGSG
ncbi:DUF1217 domain-containing protein [Thalassobius vesicularis]|uniref:DUF1217 domain-containing protein n=1 Tax=Thalassobius vesicularis TaxID=1294297 RepID=A0A4S3M8C7_9RHOB|nr:DUF1217 domain-containing protein [Thalassobius vesicularis]THD73821.1 DUF1217 domain-containing protein [Thalassobius vesicularis]